MRRRFVVTEVTGSRSPIMGDTSRLLGVTVAVHDRAYCYRDVACFQSEDGLRLHGVRAAGHGQHIGADTARRLAHELADKLNAEHGPLEY